MNDKPEHLKEILQRELARIRSPGEELEPKTQNGPGTTADAGRGVSPRTKQRGDREPTRR